MCLAPWGYPKAAGHVPGSLLTLVFRRHHLSLVPLWPKPLLLRKVYLSASLGYLDGKFEDYFSRTR